MKTIITTLLLAFIVSAAIAQTPEQRFINYEKMREDTANYYEKDISIRGSGTYSTVLMPVRDTIICYFEYVSGERTGPSFGNIDTQWYRGFAFRNREHIQYFMWKDKTKAIVHILNYQISSK